MSEQKALYRFDWDCGRMGRLSGLFLALPSQVAAAIGKTAYFGEVLGKHSEIEGEIEPDELKLVTSDLADIAVIERIFGTDNICGMNPLEHLQGEYECEDCGEHYESEAEANRCCQAYEGEL